MRELQTEDDIGFCCFCPNGAFCTFYYYFGQMVRFAPSFFFFFLNLGLNLPISVGIGGCRQYEPIRLELARINPIPHALARVVKRKKKKAGRAGSSVPHASDAGAAGILPCPCILDRK